MKIYTKQGDAGETGLWGNVRVPKDDMRIQSYGTLDELNTILGLVLSEPSVPEELRLHLSRVQGELFQLGAELATPRGKNTGIALIESRETELLEQEIDRMEAVLTPLKNFILPGGIRLSSLLHFARTVSRRAEREMVSLHRAEPLREQALIFINRLSDFLFVAARYANHLQQTSDVPWHAPQKH